MPLDPEKIRAHFPAFSEPSLDGWAFFENAGGAFACRQVTNRLLEYYRTRKVQPYGPYPASAEAGDAMDLAHARLAAALSVPVDAVHFGPSTSANTTTLARAFSARLGPDDAIIVTNQDHEANSGVWRKLAERGVMVREWGVDPKSGQLDIKDLENLLDDKTRLVAFPHASNIVGHINPVEKICAMVSAAGAVSVVDGVSFAPHGLPDVEKTGADIYLFSAYKTYGPHQGVMVVRPDLARDLPNQSHFFNDDALRKRLVPAGPDHAQVAACAGIADYLEAVAALVRAPDGQINPFRQANGVMRAQELALMEPLLAFFAGHPLIRLIGPADAIDRVPTFSIVTPLHPGKLARTLSEHKIMTGAGHFYAARLLKAIGIDPQPGVLRLSLLHYTAPHEVAALIEALDVILD
ncbi:MAG: aminotransferase class V-fold PLP-dependent enzyme [Alphaproteobacteria bacterium]|nr:aminotransferase class V-fold PLP-dependent enzyme [Alphaproteobacteria bacterium]